MTVYPKKISISDTGEGKRYTYNFNTKEATLDELLHLANKCSISGPQYKGGHRKASNITNGANLILIDIDEPGQAEAIEKRIKHYDYIKTPSASNLTYDYKWHYFIPTQEPLSIYPQAYKYQIQQFFNQIGITDDMIDTTGSYDIARQFAPALFSEADELSTINDTGLQAPIAKVPEELNNGAYESITLNIPGIKAQNLPLNSVWYQGKAITYLQAIKAIKEGVIVSGFGCPHNNNHTYDNKRGYGFAFRNDNGETIIKCTGNECKDNPYFTIPPIGETQSENEDTFITTPINPEHYRKRMEQHWLDNLKQVKANGMDYNWFIFAATMNSVIHGNTNKDTSIAHIIPMATGESKTQGSIVYLSMIPSSIKAMMVVRLNKDAEQVSEQINSIGGNSIPYNSSNDTSIEEASTYQTVIVSHEFFKNNGYRDNDKWKALSNDRELFIIDEALHSLNSITIDTKQLKRILGTIDSIQSPVPKNIIQAYIKLIQGEISTYKGYDLISPLHQDGYMNPELVKEILHTSEPVKRSEITMAIQESFSELIDILKMIPTERTISCSSRDIDQKHLESYYRDKDIKLLTKIRTLIGAGAFLSQNKQTITGVRELIPGELSYTVLDATAPVNAIYDLQREYRGDIKVIKVKRTRNYKGFTIKQVKTLTGSSSLDERSISELSNSIGAELTAGDKILFITHKINKAFIEKWKDTTNLTNITIAIEHYGNITGKNDWRDYNKIALIGLPHKPLEFYQSLNIIKTSEEEAFSQAGKQNHTAIHYTDLASDMVQAIARIRVRNITDTNGGCEPAIAYITLNSKPSLYTTLLSALQSQFKGAELKEWEVNSIIKREAKTPTGYEPTLSYLQNHLTIIGTDISIYEPRDILDVQRDTYSRLLKYDRFLTQLTFLGIEIQPRKVFDKRGRPKKRPGMFYVKISDIIDDEDSI